MESEHPLLKNDRFLEKTTLTKWHIPYVTIWSVEDNLIYSSKMVIIPRLGRS